MQHNLLPAGRLAATVYHINTNVNPPRCGEAIVLNKNLDTALKWLGSVQAGSSVHGTTQPADVVPLRLGTCAEAGYGTPAGPQEDVSAEQTFRHKPGQRATRTLPRS